MDLVTEAIDLQQIEDDCWRPEMSLQGRLAVCLGGRRRITSRTQISVRVFHEFFFRERANFINQNPQCMGYNDGHGAGQATHDALVVAIKKT